MRALVVTVSLVWCLGCSGDEFSASATDGGSSSSGGASSTGGANGGQVSSGGRSSGAGGGAGTGGSSAGGRGSGGESGSGAGGDAAGGGTVTGAGGAGGGGTGGAGAGGLASGGAGTSGAGGLGAGGTGAGGTSSVLTSCPPEPPDPAAECRGMFSCSYGTDPRPSCRSAYTCNGQSFQVTTPRCTRPRSCPMDFTPIPVIGGDCNALGDSCTWDSGLTCACIPCNTGAADCLEWYCYPGPNPPCPVSPPNKGQACEADTPQECRYAFCGAPEYVMARCAGGTWDWEAPACN